METKNLEIRIAQVVDGETLVINRGSQDGITENDRFLVYEIGEQISDPITLEPLGKLEVVKGTATVFHLQDRISTIKSDMFKTHPQKRIVRTPNPAFSGLGGFFNMTRDTIEEIETERVRQPFRNSVKIGDLVKIINRR